jgi:hypothetical protein
VDFAPFAWSQQFQRHQGDQWSLTLFAELLRFSLIKCNRLRIFVKRFSDWINRLRVVRAVPYRPETPAVRRGAVGW